MLLIVEIVVLLGVLLASRSVFQRWNKQKTTKSLYRKPPSLPSLPIIGCLPFIRGWNNIPEFFTKMSERLGPIFSINIGFSEIVLLNSKELIEEAFVTNSLAFSGRCFVYSESVVNPNRKGLVMFPTSAEWKRLHQMALTILKEFGFGVKNPMEMRILTEVEAMVNYIRQKNGETFCPKDIIDMNVTNVINNIVFGRRQDYEKGIGEVYLQFRRFFEGLDYAFDMMPMVRVLPLYRKKMFLMTDSTEKILRIIRNEIEKCKDPEAEDCFVRRYIEKDGNGFDEEQLSYTVRDLIGAGSDTTMSTLLWALVALANHPKAQDRLKDEIDTAIPQNSLPSMNDREKLPFAEATILEVMRQRTMLPLSVPRITLSDVHVNGYFIPAGTTILANLYAVHNNTKVWTDPDVFRPERFLDDSGKLVGKDHVIPFSLGRRSCFGEVLARAEIFLAIVGLVQNFVILPPEGQDKVEVKPLEPIGITTIPLPFNLRFISREKQ